MASTAKDFIEIIQEIRGTTFDENGVPQEGYWADIKGWHTTVNIQQADVSTKYTDFTTVQLPLALSYKTASETAKIGAETARTGAETAETNSEAAKDLSLTYKTHSQEWANSNLLISTAAGGNQVDDYSARYRALETKGYRDTVVSKVDSISPYYTSIDILAPIAGNITTVANISSDVTSVVTNIIPNLTEILAADTNASTATTQAVLASDWATKVTDFVTGTKNSAKSWAIGGTNEGNPLEGSAKDWATKLGSSVPSNAVEYSAKEYAIGTTVSTGSAKEWASMAHGTIVANNLYSALHYATEASTSASTASTQAGIATTKATEVTTDTATVLAAKNDTLLYRNAAIDKASEAGGYASQAAISATGAASSAVSASEQADLSQNYADNAAISAASALQSESDASTYAINSQNSATAANVSAINAAANATQANTSATNSADSAASSASSAGTATTKATEAITARDKSWAWATQDEDIVVSDGIHADGYSAYHWMKKAAAVVGGITNFVDLADVPTSYIGYAGRYLRVNGTANGIEYDVLTKEDVGLDSVDNTTDMNKPISTATQTALNSKTDTTTTTNINNRLIIVENNVAGITNEAASGSDPLRVLVDKQVYTSVVQDINTLQNQAFTTYLAVKNAIAAETIGAY